MFLFLLRTSTSSFLEFYIVETRSLFDVFFRGGGGGYISEVEDLVRRISASFQYNCAKNGKGLKGS